MEDIWQCVCAKGQALQPQAVSSRSSSGTDAEISSLPCLRVTPLSPVLVSPC